jgi:hypothetical protein
MGERTRGLSGIDIESGVTPAGKPFCHVRAVSPDGEVVLHGQLEPGETRALALQWLEAAEAADHDAAVFMELHEGLGLDIARTGQFLIHLRARRHGAPEGTA